MNACVDGKGLTVKRIIEFAYNVQVLGCVQRTGKSAHGTLSLLNTNESTPTGYFLFT